MSAPHEDQRAINPANPDLEIERKLTDLDTLTTALTQAVRDQDHKKILVLSNQLSNLIQNLARESQRLAKIELFESSALYVAQRVYQSAKKLLDDLTWGINNPNFPTTNNIIDKIVFIVSPLQNSSLEREYKELQRLKENFTQPVNIERVRQLENVYTLLYTIIYAFSAVELKSRRGETIDPEEAERCLQEATNSLPSIEAALAELADLENI